MREIEMVVEEVYSVTRTVYIKMNEKQYKDYINGENPIEGLMNHSKSVNEFISKARGKKFIESIRATDLRNDMKHKNLKYFDIDYELKKKSGVKNTKI